MSLHIQSGRILASVFVAALAAACGGVTTLGTTGGVGTSGAGVTATPASGGCVDITVTSAALGCATDSDCTLITTGTVCSTGCRCGATPVNTAASDFYDTVVPADTGMACPCAFEGEARCVASQCTLCGMGMNEPPGCSVTTTVDAGAPDGASDGGTSTSDASPGDAVVVGSDGGLCVNVDLSTYDQSCSQASDCIVILTGDVCDGTCGCGGSPVNISGQARYDQAISGVSFAPCGCPAEFPPECVAGQCVICAPGSTDPGCAVVGG